MSCLLRSSNLKCPSLAPSSPQGEARSVPLKKLRSDIYHLPLKVRVLGARNFGENHSQQITNHYTANYKVRTYCSKHESYTASVQQQEQD